MAEVAPSEDERRCRICYDDEEEEGNPLLSPCVCQGSQKYVHQGCLRSWQRSVQLSQPNNPASNNQELRHLVCSVCRTNFTLAPPARMTMLGDLSGVSPEQIQEGLLLVATRSASMRPSADIPLVWQALIEVRRAHWVKSVYLMTSAATGEGGAVSGEDSVKGVNITRAVAEGSESLTGGELNQAIQEAMSTVSAAFPPTQGHAQLHPLYFVGGPVAPDQATAACVLRHETSLEAMEGFDVDEISTIFETAGESAPIKMVYGRLDAICVLCGEEVKAVGEGGSVDINVWVGHAVWNRGQLMGEIARGSWGLMQGDATHVYPSRVLGGGGGELRAAGLWEELTNGREFLGGLGVQNDASDSDWRRWAW